jgi:hypothetical protein
MENVSQRMLELILTETMAWTGAFLRPVVTRIRVQTLVVRATRENLLSLRRRLKL